MENSKIEWTDHTFNHWQGCIKVSPGCKNCYAETLSNRWGKDIWGPGAKRQRTSAANWQKPLQWDKQAKKAGERYRVFCASMADVFEDNDQLIDWRLDLFENIIARTPNLDWLILTKRPDVARQFFGLRLDLLFPNIWMGASIESQEYADKRIPELLKIPAAIRFLSCEPLLGPIDLSGRTMETVWVDAEYADLDYNLGEIVEEEGWPIHWVIVGGESGHNARPMHPDWARSLRDQCQAAGVSYFFKQWGEWYPVSESELDQYGRYTGKEQTTVVEGTDKCGYYCDPAVGHVDHRGWIMKRVGKKAAGRLLDGQEWSQFPTVEKIPQLSPVF